ncbi:MAG: protein-export chaperone SecB [Clostridia bacterium]|nr:protein-export chaperone SecB [Clostridia bacterium]
MIKLLKMNYSELTFKLNNTLLQEKEFKINPTYKRAVKEHKIDLNKKILELTCSILSSYGDPKPFDIIVSIIAEFDVSQDISITQFSREATLMLYPYLGSAIANLMSTANFPPIYLNPLPNGILFKEDMEVATND